MMQEAITFMIMDSLIGKEYARVERLYDLKGSRHGRLTKLTEDQEKFGSGLKTLKDNNFHGMEIKPDQQQDILRRLQRDSMFLSQLGLIDYSLLLTRIRKRQEGDPPDDGTAALLKDENGDFILQRLKTIRKTKSVHAVKDDSSDSSLE